MRLEYRHLEVLVAIDDAGSLTAAARALGTNQPHVSRQLRRIEEHLGVPVFRRTTDGVRPTAAGTEVLARARRALSAAQEFGARQERGTVLRIAYERLAAPALLSRLLVEHPDVTPELAVASATEAFTRLTSGAADVYLGVVMPHVSWPTPADLVVQRVVSDPLRVLLAADHRLAGRETVVLADLSHDDWVVTSGPGARETTIGECRRVGGFEPRLRYQVHDSDHVRALLRDGLGVAFASSTWTADDGAVLRPYQGAGFAHWSVVSVPGRLPPAVTATLVELVRRHLGPAEAPAGRTRPPAYT